MYRTDTKKGGYEQAFEKSELTGMQSRKVDIVEQLIIGLLMMAISLSVYSYEQEFEDNREYDTEQWVVLCLISLTTGATLILIAVKNHFYRWLLVYRKEIPEGFGIVKTFGLQKLVFEYSILLLHPNPQFIHRKFWTYSKEISNFYYYNMNDMLTIALGFKSIYIVAQLLFQTRFGSSRSGRISSMFGCTCDLRFIIKCLLKHNPQVSIFLSLLYMILVFGWVVKIAESPLDRVQSLEQGNHLFGYANSCWLAVITMTTVGYGDMSPRTIVGKLIMVACAFAGIIIVSLMVVIITNELDFNGPEGNAYTVMKKLQYKELLRETALRILKTSVKKIQRPDGTWRVSQSVFNNLDQADFVHNIEKFKRLRRTYKDIGQATVTDEIARNFANVFNHQTDIKEMIIEDKSDYGGGTGTGNGTAPSNERCTDSIREVIGSEGTGSEEGSLRDPQGSDEFGKAGDLGCSMSGGFNVPCVTPEEDFISDVSMLQKGESGSNRPKRKLTEPRKGSQPIFHKFADMLHYANNGTTSDAVLIKGFGNNMNSNSIVPIFPGDTRSVKTIKRRNAIQPQPGHGVIPTGLYRSTKTFVEHPVCPVMGSKPSMAQKKSKSGLEKKAAQQEKKEEQFNKTSLHLSGSKSESYKSSFGEDSPVHIAPENSPNDRKTSDKSPQSPIISKKENQGDLIQISKNFKEKNGVGFQKKNSKVGGVRKKISNRRIKKQGASSGDIQLSAHSNQNYDSWNKLNKDPDSKFRRDSCGSLINDDNQSPLSPDGRSEIPMKSEKEIKQEAYIKWVEDKLRPKRAPTIVKTLPPPKISKKDAKNSRLSSLSRIPECKRWGRSGTIGTPTIPKSRLNSNSGLNPKPKQSPSKCVGHRFHKKQASEAFDDMSVAGQSIAGQVKNESLESLPRKDTDSSPNNGQNLSSSEQAKLDAALLRIKKNAKKGYNSKGSFVPKRSKIQRHLQKIDPELGEKIQREQPVRRGSVNRGSLKQQGSARRVSLNQRGSINHRGSVLTDQTLKIIKTSKRSSISSKGGFPGSKFRSSKYVIVPSGFNPNSPAMGKKESPRAEKSPLNSNHTNKLISNFDHPVISNDRRSNGDSSSESTANLSPALRYLFCSNEIFQKLHTKVYDQPAHPATQLTTAPETFDVGSTF